MYNIFSPIVLILLVTICNEIVRTKREILFRVMHSTIIHRLVITNTGGRKEVLLVFISKVQKHSINRWHGTLQNIQ